MINLKKNPKQFIRRENTLHSHKCLTEMHFLKSTCSCITNLSQRVVMCYVMCPEEHDSLICRTISLLLLLYIFIFRVTLWQYCKSPIWAAETRVAPIQTDLLYIFCQNTYIYRYATFINKEIYNTYTANGLHSNNGLWQISIIYSYHLLDAPSSIYT